jgi:hypothetical protein
MNPDLISHRLGTTRLKETADVIAGSMGTWTLTYTVGSYGIDSGGQLKVAFPLVTDWETPQFTSGEESGYTTVFTSGNAKLRTSWHPKGYVRPWNPCIVIDIYDGSLDPNDTITIIFGETALGSPGIRAQTYLESKFEFRTLVDPTNSNDPRRIPTSPQIRIVSDDITDLVCIVPSQANINEPVEIFVKGEDKWRNPTPAPDQLQYSWVGNGSAKIDNGHLTIDATGTGYLIVEATVNSTVLQCQSNPITIQANSQPIQRYWGDLHAQTKSTVGTGDEDEYFTFGRDIARLDFASHQGNDFQITDEYWQHLNDVSAKYHEDGKFVVFPGYEWSANSPAGGDHNVFYRNEGQPILRSSHWLVPDIPETDLTPAHPADVFYDKMKSTVSLDDVIIAQHVGGRYANLRKYFDQDLVSLVELVSCWGMFEWMLWDALERDYIVGVMCNSDGHHGRPGAEGAGMADFGIKNGLTCVLANVLTRDGVFDALKQRHCYGTTGTRLLLDFRANNALMGDVVLGITDEIQLDANVIGTSDIDSIQLYHGTELIHEERPKSIKSPTESNHIRISWQGSRERGRQRRVIWDGVIRFTDTEVERVELFSFDSIQDGIIDQTSDEITFKSRTTGDRDGLDIWLKDAKKIGTMEFQSEAGVTKIDLSALTENNPQQSFDYDGVDMQLIVERYGYFESTRELSLEHIVTPSDDKLNAYFVKVTQVDGHMAWSSPIYVDNRKSL